MKKKVYTYEVEVPVREIWVMHVQASNKKEAFLKAQDGDGEQICTISGTKKKVTRLLRK